MEHIRRALHVVFAVAVLVGHVVCVVHEQNEVIIGRLLLADGLAARAERLHIRDNALIKLLDCAAVLESALAQRCQQLMLLAFHHLHGSEFDFIQVLPERAGKGALENGHIFFVFFLRHGDDRLRKIGNDVPVRAHVAAVDDGRVALIRIQAAFDFRKIPWVHNISPYNKKH